MSDGTVTACPMCQSNEAVESSGGDGFTVARTRTGYVSIFFARYFAGHTIFTADRHIGELHELDPETRTVHLDEMARVAEAVFRVQQPRKMNYVLLGNSPPAHVHWSLVPRYADDAEPTKSPWEDPGFWAVVTDPAARTVYPAPSDFERLIDELRTCGVTLEREFPPFG